MLYAQVYCSTRLGVNSRAHGLVLTPWFPPSLSLPLQLANVAGSPVFSDKNRYPHLFRALPPEPGIQRAQGIVVNHFEWDEVAYIAENSHLFSFVSEPL